MRPVEKQVLGAIGILSLIILVLVVVPKVQVADTNLKAKDRIELENKLRTTLAQILGGAVILVGLFFTWRTVKAREEGLRLSQESLERNWSLGREGQITERFTRAIDQLGNKELWIRLGGLYALERIARDSDEKDHWTVMEVLTAYVRGYKRDEPFEAIPIDVQAILTVLGRRTRTYMDGEDNRLDLTRANIRKADLIGVNLVGASLIGVNLVGASLAGANLEGDTFLTKEQIESAIIDENTKLPDYLKGSTEGKAGEGRE